MEQCSHSRDGVVLLLFGLEQFSLLGESGNKSGSVVQFGVMLVVVVWFDG